MKPNLPWVDFYSSREWQAAVALFVSYVALFGCSVWFVPIQAYLNPADALAVAILFFWGMRLAPIVLIAALIAALIAQVSGALLIVIPLAAVAKSIAGARLLHIARIDPLFRGYRDVFFFLASSLAVSFIEPTLLAFANALTQYPFTVEAWGYAYVASLSSLVIVTPLSLRWIAKSLFRRTVFETIEIVVVFGLLVLVDVALFIAGIPSVFGISLVYILLIPLFIISLRQRPRFVTLALLVTSVFALTSVIERTPASKLMPALFGMELFLVVVAIIFYIIAALEENRRVSTNLLRAQIDTVENAIARVKSESQAKNDFIAILSHELRNPLAPVVSAIELLRIKGGRDTDETQTLDMIANRLSTVRRLLDDLLEVSKISEGKMSIRKEVIDISDVIKRAIVSTNHHRHDLHQHFVFSGVPHPLLVNGDPVRLEQIFSNLLTNASKYSKEGDTVSLILRDEGDAVAIDVVDTGVGIAPDDLETIFLPFEQVEGHSRDGKSLGIGLTLVRSFAELHEGTVEAMSDGPGRGSRFTVRLPLVKAPVAVAINALSSVQKSKQKALSVLVVDDNDAAAAGIGRLLEWHGCTVNYAYNGAQAIEQAMNLAPDVVLLDVGLPDSDGYVVAKTLKERGFKGRLIALTGYDKESVKARDKHSGFEQYIVKPAGMTELQRVMPELS